LLEIAQKTVQRAANDAGLTSDSEAEAATGRFFAGNCAKKPCSEHRMMQAIRRRRRIFRVKRKQKKNIRIWF